MKWAVTIIVVCAATVLMYGLAHAFYNLMQTVSVALGGGA